MIRLSLAIPLLAAATAFAQKPLPRQQMPRNGTLATLVREANLYANPDDSGGPISDILPGRELVVAEKNGKWLRVFANTDAPDTRESDVPVFGTEGQAQPISGWMLNKGIVDINTPHGDLILFGAADDLEQQADVSNPPPHVAEEARLLYRRIVTMYPDSPWTPEAMYRAADIRWQLQKADASTLPSAHEKENYLREQMDEDEMRKVLKYFSGTAVGRPRRLRPHRKQTLRRLAGLREVPRAGDQLLPQIRGRAPQLTQSRRGTLRRALASGRRRRYVDRRRRRQAR